MSSRKMCVVLLLVLTILWGLSVGNVQAQGRNENKGAGASASSEVTDLPSESTSTSSSSSSSSSNSASSTGTAGDQPQQTTGTTGPQLVQPTQLPQTATQGTPATSRKPEKPEKPENKRPVAGRAAGGGGSYRITGGTGVSNGQSQGYGSAWTIENGRLSVLGPNGQFQVYSDKQWKSENGRLQVLGPDGQFQDYGPFPPGVNVGRNVDVMIKAQAQAQGQEGFRRVERSFGRADGLIMGRRSLSGPVDPETRALEEKEQKLDEDVQKTADQYKSATDKEERAKLKKQLEELAGQQFDIRQQFRGLEVKHLENELARIRDSIQKRTENREQIIKRRVAQLVHEEEDLEF